MLQGRRWTPAEVEQELVKRTKDHEDLLLRTAKCESELQQATMRMRWAVDEKERAEQDLKRRQTIKARAGSGNGRLKSHLLRRDWAAFCLRPSSPAHHETTVRTWNRTAPDSDALSFGAAGSDGVYARGGLHRD